jgi:dihydroneopterin aldolase
MQDPDPADTLQIALTDVPIALQLGVSAEERALPQTIFVSLTLTREAPKRFARGAVLNDTLDYDALIALLREDVPRFGPYLLIEAIAEEIAAGAFALDPAARIVEVLVKKPSVLAGQGLVSASLRRARPARVGPRGGRT